MVQFLVSGHELLQQWAGVRAVFQLFRAIQYAANPKLHVLFLSSITIHHLKPGYDVSSL